MDILDVVVQKDIPEKTEYQNVIAIDILPLLWSWQVIGPCFMVKT